MLEINFIKSACGMETGLGFRIVLIENEASVRLKLNNLIINNSEGELWIPIDDISMIVLDNQKIMLSARVMVVLAQNNIGVIICNMEHLPIGFYSSYDNHSRISKTIGFQIDKEQEYYDNLWQLVVREKLNNQKSVLQKLNMNNEIVMAIEGLVKEIIPGDKTNREAHGAKIYFNTLMGTTFSRGNEDILLNSGLDYGYTIIRSYIARLCVAYGLNTQIGIHHKNEYNRFNLVDDLIEPLRPFVDIYVYKIMNDEKYFTIEHRRKLVNILNHYVVYKNRKMHMANMIEEYVEQYASYLMGRSSKIVFPDINGYIGEADGI